MSGGVRANAYRMLAAAILSPPDSSLLQQIAALPSASGDDACGRALTALQKAVAAASPQEAAEDYQQLFIGLGRGKVMPYGSWHISGRMMDKPLARLRSDLQTLGLARRPDVGEPEDHAGALCETMAVLCAEEDGEAAASAEAAAEAGAALEKSALSFSRQQKIFAAHLEPWLEIFFADIVRHAEGDFYRAFGAFGAAFAAFERRYFAMPF